MVRPTSGESRSEVRRAVLTGQCRHAGLRPGAAACRALGRRRSCWPASVPTPRTLASVAAVHPAAAWLRDERGVLVVRSRKARELAAAVPHMRGAAAGSRGRRPGRGPRRPARARHDRRRAHARAAAPGRRPRAPSTWPAASSPTTSGPRPPTCWPTPRSGYWAAGVLPPLVRRELTGPFDRLPATAARSPAAPADARAAPRSSTPSAGSTPPAGPPGGPRWTRGAPTTGRGPPRCTRPPGPATSPGRTRTLAAAQLHAVQAFLDGGFDLHDGAAGVWNALAGCVQGTVVADLLDEAVARRPAGALGAASPDADPSSDLGCGCETAGTAMAWSPRPCTG